MNNFDRFIDRVLGHEGGYSNRKPQEDPGGETKWGISKRSYPTLNIVDLSREDAIQIYKADFWAKVHAEEMHPALAYQALDFAVNSGPETAIRKLQEALGVADDGHWGPITREAARAHSMPYDAIMVLARYVAIRMHFQRKLTNFQYNAGGWTARNADNLLFGVRDVGEAV